MKKIFSIFLTVLILGTMCVPTYAAEFSTNVNADILQDTENNNTIESAQVIKSGQTVHGNMELSSDYHGTSSSGTVIQDYMDMDYFKFTLTEKSAILISVFPIDYAQDDYIFATVSKADDKTIDSTQFEYSESAKQQMSILNDCTLDAGTYYITVLNSINDSKYNQARYICYFEAVPESEGQSQSTSRAQGLSNFTKVNNYQEGQFSDVSNTSWCAENVEAAYEYGIMAGKNESYFGADSNLTIAQTIVMACRIRSTYYADNYSFEQSTPWYQSYVDYAIKNNIISSGYSEYDTAISRAGFATILNGALPDTALPAINSVEENAIPDVEAGSNYYNATYRLYRAGILTGNDSAGTFSPFSKITRGAAAAIVSRMANTSLRKNITLKALVNPTSVALSTTTQTIYVGKGFGLSTTISPTNVTNKAVTWSSSNRSVATVDASGYVYGVAPGKATITAKTSNGKTASCVVTVIQLVAVSHSDSYGTVKGSITWQYNQYIGTKADVGANVLLLPDGIKTSAFDNSKPAMLQSGNSEACIYYGQADGYGSYEIDHVPSGTYKILIISNKTTSGWRFNDPDGWKTNLEGDLALYFSSTDLETLELMIGYSSYTISTVIVTGNSVTTYSHDFGYTYI